MSDQVQKILAGKWREGKTKTASSCRLKYRHLDLDNVMISFHANHIAVTREAWGDLVVLSIDEDLASEQYLMLQAKDRYDEQDVRFGMDDIYVETCGPGWSWYGNIESFELSRNRLSVEFSREAAIRMGNDGKVEATFSLDETAYARLRKALQKIFDGKDYYRDGSV